MIRKALFAAASIAMLAGTPSFAAKPCRDAHGRFAKCPAAAVAAKPTSVAKVKPAARTAAAPKGVHCKLNGKFAKCGTPGAKPA